jgi:multiple antibiotic resistance protein
MPPLQTPDPSSLLQFSLIALSSVFFLVDPIATVPVFLTMTAGASSAHRRRMAKRAAITCVAALSAFALAGALIFRLFGITLPAFQVAGGLILLLIGLDMVQARRSGMKQAPGELEEAAAKEDVGIIPLGMPMLAGPGAISTVMVLMGPTLVWQRAVPVFAAIGITSLVSYLALAGADRVRRHVSDTAIHIITRIMGMLLTAIAVQFIVTGLAALGIGREM